MDALRYNDLQYIVRHIPSDIRKIMMNDPGIRIGGGFIRSIMAREKISDIDMFGSSEKQLEDAAEELRISRGIPKIHRSGNALTVLAPPRWPVQLVTRWMFPTALSCVSSFDFTVCQAIIWHEPQYQAPPIGDVDQVPIPAKWCSFCHNDFYADLANRRLVYTYPQRDEDAGGSIMRVRRFLAKGYNIQPQSLAGVIARLVMGVEEIKKVHFPPPGEQYLAKILQALLVEVDPLMIRDGMEIIPADDEDVKESL